MNGSGNKRVENGESTHRPVIASVRQFNNMTNWHVVHDDILERHADGLLCSANPNLNLSGGVGGAFSLRYGGAMQTYLHSQLTDSSIRFMSPGESVIAPPCGSPFVAVAYAVSIDAFYDTNAEAILRAYDSAIRGLAERGCRTIVAACLACGYGRVSDGEFVRISTKLFESCYDTVADISLVTTNEGLATALATALATSLSVSKN